MWIDSHTHIYTEEFDGDRSAMIEAAQTAGVEHCVVPNVDVDSLDALWQLKCDHRDYVSIAAGLHPTSVGEQWQADLSAIRKFVQTHYSDLVAIGEIGLDTYWDDTFIEQQKTALLQQFEWAAAYNLPVILHVRDAFDHCFEVLDQFGADRLRGVFHSFTGTPGELSTIIERYPHFYVGINGVLTFKNSSLRDYITQLPLERVLLETDAPYLAPVPKRGKRNEPAFLPYTGEHLAEQYQISAESLAKITADNARQLFQI